jgi:hypothetical protein
MAPYIIVIKSLLLGGFRRQTGLMPRAGLQGGGSREGGWPEGPVSQLSPDSEKIHLATVLSQVFTCGTGR